VIEEIDGQDVRNAQLMVLKRLLSGPVGSVVHLKLRRYHGNKFANVLSLSLSLSLSFSLSLSLSGAFEIAQISRQQILFFRNMCVSVCVCACVCVYCGPLARSLLLRGTWSHA